MKNWLGQPAHGCLSDRYRTIVSDPGYQALVGPQQQYLKKMNWKMEITLVSTIMEDI